MSNPIDNYNKIVTTVNSVTSDYTFEADANNLIVIDTSNNRIGINTVHPQRSIHISGGDISSGIITPYLQMISGGEGVGSDFIPSEDDTFALGSESKQWKDIYVGPGSIYMNNKRIFSLNNIDNLIIDNSNGGTNEIQFQGEIKFTGGVTFDNTPTIASGLPLTQTAKVNIDGGNIYGTLIGKKTDGTLDTCGGFFSKLEVDETSTFKQDLIIENDISVNQKLKVGSDASLNANVDISNHLTVLGDVSLNANVDISNHLTVLGDVSLNANVDISNHLTVLGDVSLNANVDISNHLTVLGDVSLNANVDVSNHLTVLGDVSLNANVDISNYLTVLGDVSFNSNLNIGNDLIIKNSIKFVFG